MLSQTGSGVAGKHRQGGQSAKRFQKLREMELTYYYNRVATTTREYFIDIYKIKGLIVSGPGPTKEDFVQRRVPRVPPSGHDHLDDRLVVLWCRGGQGGVRQVV